MDAQLQALKELIAGSRRMVFFGGAGVSTESGIPDFRSEDGVFRAVAAYGRPPEELLGIDFFLAHPDTFYDYYKKLMVCPDARPNAAHLALAGLEREGKLTAVVTQNIDGLHQLAGSKNVLELHGSMLRNYCMACGKKYSLEEILQQPGVPHCTRDACGGIIRPDVVLYGEALDDEVVSASIRHIREADLLIVGGTSLVVYPAAGLISYFRGQNLVLINKSATPYDKEAGLVINAPIGEVFSQVMGG